MHRCLLHNVEWKVLPGNALAGKGCKECMKAKNRARFTKSHESYVSRLYQVNPNIVAIERYIDSSTPILHLCKTHNIKWKAYPSNLLKGQGCSECGKEKIYNNSHKSQNDYIKELQVKNPKLEVAGEYVNANTPIPHRCRLHGIVWNISPAGALAGHGCNECRSEKFRKILGKTHEDYVKELSTKNPTVEVVEHYVNSKTKLKHHCLIHDEYWVTSPFNVLKGCGCPQCLKERMSLSNSFNQKDYINILKSKNSNVIPIGEYVNVKTPILHKCKVHDYDWMTTPDSVLQGCGCPQCSREKISSKLKKTASEYLEELKVANPDIIALEDYIDSRTPILHKCLIHNHVWRNSPTHILSGTGCPLCLESRGERLVRQWLEEHRIDFEFQKIFVDCRDEKPLPFDFYLPKYNLCIEYQGQQHYKPIDYFGGLDNLAYVIKHDKIKESYCKDNGISLLHIPYYKKAEEELNNFLLI